MALLLLTIVINAMIHFRKIARHEFIQYNPENLFSTVLILAVIAAQYWAGQNWVDSIGLLIVAPALRWIVHDITLNYLRGLAWDYLSTRSKLDKFLRTFQNKTGLHFIFVKAALIGVSLFGWWGVRNLATDIF